MNAVEVELLRLEREAEGLSRKRGGERLLHVLAGEHGVHLGAVLLLRVLEQQLVHDQLGVVRQPELDQPGRKARPAFHASGA